MLRIPARPDPCRLPLLCDPDNHAAQMAAALREGADAHSAADVDGVADEAARVMGLLAPVLTDMLGEAGGAAGRRLVGAAQVRQVAAQIRVIQAQQAYRLTADPAELVDPEPPGAWVELRGLADWSAVESAARATLPPSPAVGELVAQRVYALAHAAALAGDGDTARSIAEHLDKLTPDERRARDAYEAWLRRYYAAVAERVIVAVVGGLPTDVPPEACRASGARFPVAAFAQHVEADAVFAEAVELARVRYSAGKARRSRGSASGKGAPSGSALAPPDGPARSAQRPPA